jgi:hypothetical protein
MLSGSCRIRSGLLLGVLGCATSQAVAQEVELQRLSDHVIVMRLPGISYTNIVAVSTARGLVVIDTESSPVTMRPLKQAAERAFGRDDWALVINTHPHFHHAGGNALFEGAQIIGHESFPRVVREHDLPRPMEPPGPFHGHVQQLEAELAEVADPERAFSLRQAITFLTEANQELLAGFELRTPTTASTIASRSTWGIGTYGCCTRGRESATAASSSTSSRTGSSSHPGSAAIGLPVSATPTPTRRPSAAGWPCSPSWPTRLPGSTPSSRATRPRPTGGSCWRPTSTSRTWPRAWLRPDGKDSPSKR